jgi:hypothetical protein
LFAPHDTHYFVHPGRNMTFTAMQHIATEVEGPGPKPFLSLSTQEYYTLTGFHSTRQLRHLRKSTDAVQNGELSIQRIESEMPTGKTMDLEVFLQRVNYLELHYGRLTEFYDARYNKWSFWNYRGRQKRTIASVKNVYRSSRKDENQL